MAVILALVALLLFCASSGPFTLQSVSSPEDTGDTFTLYIMQDEAGRLAARAAVADMDGDGVRLEPAVSRYDLKAYEDVRLSEALEISRAALSTHCAYTGHMLRGLKTRSGQIAGYEIIPSYTPFICESAPSVYLDYFQKENGRVRVVLRVMGKARDAPLKLRPKPSPQ
jgi:hypothetical protein